MISFLRIQKPHDVSRAILSPDGNYVLLISHVKGVSETSTFFFLRNRIDQQKTPASQTSQISQQGHKLNFLEPYK